MTYTLRQGRKRLATIWFGLAGLLFVILLAQTFLGALGTHVFEAWGWFLGNTAPTVSVIAVDMVADATPQGRPADSETEVEPFYYRASLGFSIAYFLTILATLVGWRVTDYQEPFEFMALSTTWLAPLQTVTLTLISIFFKKAAQQKGGKEAPKASTPPSAPSTAPAGSSSPGN